MSELSAPIENDQETDSAHSTGPTALVLPDSLRQALLAHLRAWLPFEGCALLGGRFDPDGRAISVALYPGANALHSRTRYQMAATDLIAAHKDMRKANLDLVAIAHSHPNSGPIPSTTDLAEACYPKTVMLIIGFAGGNEDVRAWQLHADWAERARQIPIES